MMMMVLTFFQNTSHNSVITCFCVSKEILSQSEFTSDHFKLKLDLFDSDYETSFKTYINPALWHQCLRSCGRKPAYLGDQPLSYYGDHMTK